MEVSVHVKPILLNTLLCWNGIVTLKRTAFTVTCWSMGVHPKVVQELLGHNQNSMRMDTYSHVMQAHHSA